MDHNPLTCIVAETFPRIETGFQAKGSVARVRAYFRAQAGKRWYFVEMKAEGDRFTGVLPKPKRSTRQILYYIEATDRAFLPERTREHDPRVVERAVQCKDGAAAAAVASARVRVQGEPGAPAIPEGFEAAGIETDSAEVAAGGRHLPSRKTLGIAAAGVLAGGAALALKGGSNGTPVPGAVSVSPEGQALVAATTMTFAASATDPDNDPLTYSWDFGDGSSGSGGTATHVYTRDGTFTPAVTVSDGKASARATGTAVTARAVSGPWTITLGSSQLRDSAFVLNQGGAALTGQRNVSGLIASLSGQVGNPREITLSSVGTSSSAPSTPSTPNGLADGAGGRMLFRRIVRLAFLAPRLSDRGNGATYPAPREAGVFAQTYPYPEPSPEPTPRPPRRRSPYENSALCPFSARLTFDANVNQASGTITPEGPCADFGPATITMRR
jgi:hypothetical protein